MTQNFFIFILFIIANGALLNESSAQCTKENIAVSDSLILGESQDKSLTIELKGIQKINIAIFDYWGQEVYTAERQLTSPLSANFTKVNTAWKGLHKGKKAKAGLYVYSIDAVCVDGKTTRKGGTIILIRK